MNTAHGPSPAPTKAWAVPAGQWRKSHCRRVRLLVLDDRDALPVEDEKVLLHRFGVVAAGRLARPHDLDVDARVRPGHAVRLELDERGPSRGPDRGRVGEID